MSLVDELRSLRLNRARSARRQPLFPVGVWDASHPTGDDRGVTGSPRRRWDL